MEGHLLGQEILQYLTEIDEKEFVNGGLAVILCSLLALNIVAALVLTIL